MTRDLLVRVAAATLARYGDPDAAAKAEAIAAQLDMFATVMGGGPTVAPLANVAPSPFPAVNPEAIITVPAPPPQPPRYDPRAADNMILPATSVPDKIERIMRPASPVDEAPVRSLRQPPGSPAAGRMKVEELNLIIQQRTPPSITFNVPTEDGGGFIPTTFVRNVISRHVEDSVALVYYPPNARPSAQEATEVQRVIAIDDLPVDLGMILKDIEREAIETLRPRAQAMSVPPMRPPGPVQTAGAYADNTPGFAGADVLGQVGAVFDSSSNLKPNGYITPLLPSEMHAGQAIAPEFKRSHGDFNG